MAITRSIMTVAALAGGVLTAQSAFAASPEGVWMDNTGRGAIEIAPCATGLCGHVVWVKDNSDAKKGCGKQIIGDVKEVGGGSWDNGWIYSPEKRRNYDVELKPLNNGDLRVTGYAGTKFFSKTMIWKPAPADLQRCSTEAKAEPALKAKTAETAAPAPVKQKVAAIETPKVDAPTVVEAVAAPVKQPKATVAKPVVEEEETAAPVPYADPKPAQSNDQEASTNSQDDQAEEEEAPRKRGRLAERLKNLNLGDLDLDQVISRKGGKCNLDLPWVKVKFNCGE